jgi:hypothetical protein
MGFFLKGQLVEKERKKKEKKRGIEIWGNQKENK